VRDGNSIALAPASSSRCSLQQLVFPIGIWRPAALRAGAGLLRAGVQR